MTEEFDGYSFDDDVSLDEDEKNAGGVKQDWLKFTAKGQLVRCAFVYFFTYNANAVQAALKAAKKADKKLTPEEMELVAKKALSKRAEALGKSVDQLTPVDKLDISTAHFRVMRAHYREGLGYVVSRLGKDGADADALWKSLPEAKTYFSTLLLVYPTDSEGNINKEALATQIKQEKLKFLPWRFSPRVYDEIWKTNDGLRQNNLAMSSQDVKLECREPQYQNISVSFLGGAVWQKNEIFKKVVLANAINFYDKISPFREMTTDQLRAKLGVGGTAIGDVSTDDFNSMLNQI